MWYCQRWFFMRNKDTNGLRLAFINCQPQQRRTLSEGWANRKTSSAVAMTEGRAHNWREVPGRHRGTTVSASTTLVWMLNDKMEPSAETMADLSEIKLDWTGGTRLYHNGLSSLLGREMRNEDPGCESVSLSTGSLSKAIIFLTSPFSSFAVPFENPVFATWIVPPMYFFPL